MTQEHEAIKPKAVKTVNSNDAERTMQKKKE
jgi:hypothetical protein